MRPRIITTKTTVKSQRATWVRVVNRSFERCALCRCVCRAGFDGPRCQQTRHSFSGGESWALYPALSLCAHSHTGLELMTRHDDALVMYHGPITDQLQPDQAADFILLELRNGFPMLRVDHGSGLMLLLLLLLLDQPSGTDRVGGQPSGTYSQVFSFVGINVELTVVVYV